MLSGDVSNVNDLSATVGTNATEMLLGAESPLQVPQYPTAQQHPPYGTQSDLCVQRTYASADAAEMLSGDVSNVNDLSATVGTNATEMLLGAESPLQVPQYPTAQQP